MNEFVKYSHVGVLFISIFLVFLCGGMYLDKQIDTQPIFTILGTLLGFAMACYKLIKETEVKKK